MPTFKILSVQEDDDNINRISGEQGTTYKIKGSKVNQPALLKLSVTNDKKLIIQRTTLQSFLNYKPVLHESFEVNDIDIDGLIQYLQAAKEYLEEEEVYKKLTGVK